MNFCSRLIDLIDRKYQTGIRQKQCVINFITMNGVYKFFNLCQSITSNKIKLKVRTYIKGKVYKKEIFYHVEL